MFPKPENVRLSVAQQIASMELMLPAFENADETSDREEVKGIWEEALGKSRAMLLGEWRNVPQHAAGVLQATTAKILTERRSEWLDDKLAGKYSDVNLSETGKISYNTIQSYRRGGRIRASTRRALSDALNELGISCNFEEVRQ